MSVSFDGSFSITNTGASRAGDAHAYGRAWRLRYFCAGAGGHDLDTNLPLRVDPTLVDLPNATTGLIQFQPGQIVKVDFRKNLVKTVFPQQVGTGVLSSIGIYGEIFAVTNPDDEAMVGNTFLYAVCNVGYNLKARNSVRTFNLILNSI